MRIAPTALVLALSIGCSVALPSTPAGKAAKASARERERIKLTAYTTRAQRPGPAAAQAQA